MSDQLQINIGADTKGLETGLQKATAAVESFDKNVKKTVSSSGQATLALGNLGRVASDAPFGFIAISNNIEPLVQSLQSLGKTSGGLGGTLKALGASLIGPGGLLLGFSLVSSALTVAVQRYGSLGNAVNAIFGKQDALVKQTAEAAKSYEKFNQQLKQTVDIQAQASGSAQGEISRVNALATIVQDQTRSYNERNQALKDLQAISKTYFGNIDLEKGKLGELTTAVNNYTQATIQSAITKGFESEIGAVNVELNKQANLLAKLQERLDAARRAPQRIVGIAATVDTRDIIAAEEAFNAQAKVVRDLEARTQELNTAIGESINRYNSIVAPVTAAADAAKLKAEQDKKAADAAAKQAAAQSIVNAKLKEYNDLVKRQETFKARLQTVDFVPPQLPEINIPAKISATVPQSTLDSFKAFADEQSKLLDTNTLQLYAGIFSDTIAPAIDSAFGALASGTSVIESLKNSLKGLLAQLAANAAKALIFKAALSFIPGLGTAGAIGGGGILQSLLGGNLLGGIGGAAAPRFGGTSAFSGGLQLAGQVVFTQRGTDLVGVLNSSNARIGRVG